MAEPRRNILTILTYGGPDDEYPELKKLIADVAVDEDEYTAWDKLVNYAEALEGGLNRNSSPHAIDFVRKVYDLFLAKFPLFFGYWKKYADLEFSIAGTEAAELVYERGVASVPTSVDLWTHFCHHKITTSHDPQIIRELFDRAADSVGLDFMSHPFWDKYLEFEDRMEESTNDPATKGARIFDILGRLISLPTYSYAKYFDRYRQLAAQRPVLELASADILQQFQAELDADPLSVTRSEIEKERLLRGRLDQYHLSIYNRTQVEVQKRWQFEGEIKRPYFHVTELEDSALVNWRKYLDFEESEGNYDRIVFLYERCLVSCANYSEFWLRYARWMLSQDGKDEEVRNIYQRASYLFVPIAEPEIRLLWARFEEMTGRIHIARDIHRAILLDNPSHLDTIISWVNLERRHDGIDAAVQVLEATIHSLKGIAPEVQGALIAEQARLLYHVKGSSEEARQLFQNQHNLYLNSSAFWKAYLQFELGLVTGNETQEAIYKRINQVHELIRTKTHLQQDVLKDLSHQYMAFLLERGDKGAVKEYMELDKQVNGLHQDQKTAASKVSVPHQRH